MKHLNISHVISVKDDTVIFYPLPFNYDGFVIQKTLVNDIEREGFSLSNGGLIPPLLPVGDDMIPDLKVGDVIEVVFDPNSNNFLHIIKQYGASLFKQYASDQRLRYNDTYHIEGVIGNFTFDESFKTYYDPYFSTPEKVRKITGMLLENVSDEDIMEEIAIVSNETKETYMEANSLTVLENKDVPVFLPNYVTYKVAYTFAYAAYLTITGKLGSVEKRLSKMSISSQVNLPYIDDMLGRLERKLKGLDDAVNGSGHAPKSFVKAGNTAYPLNVRGSF